MTYGMVSRYRKLDVGLLECSGQFRRRFCFRNRRRVEFGKTKKMKPPASILNHDRRVLLCIC